MAGLAPRDPRRGRERLRGTERGRHLQGGGITACARWQVADNMVPDLVRNLDALPLTTSGKAGRRELARVVVLDLTAS